MGKLYVVNLTFAPWEDVTLRAGRVLRQAVLIVTLDAGSVGPWLAQGEVHAPLLGLEETDLGERVQSVLDALNEGDVAWVTPGPATWTGDDGAFLRALLAQGVEVLSVPGGDDLVTGLILSGLPSSRFAFLGAFPASLPEGRELLRQATGEQHTLVCRVRGPALSEALRAVRELMGERQVAIYGGAGIWRGPVGEALAQSGPVAPGEGQDAWQLLFIAGASEACTWTEARVRDELRALQADGASIRDAAHVVAERSGWRRRAVYEIALQMRVDRGER